MSEELSIETERADDLPVLLAQLEKMQVASLLDEHFPSHGNWQGVSVGTTCVVWLGKCSSSKPITGSIMWNHGRKIVSRPCKAAWISQ